MQSTKKFAFSALLAGIILGVAGVGIYAHAHGPEGHGSQSADQLSITGSPAELAQRARDLGQHICETIKAASTCPVTRAADEAFTALTAMQDNYQHGQEQIHAALTSANFDGVAFTPIQAEQAQEVQASTTRYLQFLADAATALTPEQRLMFSRKAPAGK